jgi:ribosome maturation factor RimP
MSESPVLDRVRALVEPIVSDLRLDLYDIEQRGGTLRITLDAPGTTPEGKGGVDLEQLALATRLISRELDHHDPVPGRYTLEVSSPGLERNLRRPEHFARVVGQIVNVRLTRPDSDGRRRFEGRLVASDDTSATLLVTPDKGGEPGEHTVALASIERAKTVFVWGPAPKPGKRGSKAPARRRAPGPHDELDPEPVQPGDELTDDELTDDFDDDTDDEFTDDFDDFDDDFSDDPEPDETDQETP